MAIVPAEEYLEEHEAEFEVVVPEEYEEWRDDEGIPVHTGVFFEDMHDLETGAWDRTGESGAIVNFYGAEGLNDIQLQELSPGGRTKKQHHFYEELVYVAEGSGVTAVGADDETTFEWSEGALFYLPRATPFRHLNVSPDDRARLISSTPLPLQFFLNKDEEFIFDPGYNYWAGVEEKDFFSARGRSTVASTPVPGTIERNQRCGMRTSFRTCSSSINSRRT